MREKKNWSMTRAQKKTFRIGTPDREWEFSIHDFVYILFVFVTKLSTFILPSIADARDFEILRKRGDLFFFHKNA